MWIYLNFFHANSNFIKNNISNMSKGFMLHVLEACSTYINQGKNHTCTLPWYHLERYELLYEFTYMT